MRWASLRVAPPPPMQEGGEAVNKGEVASVKQVSEGAMRGVREVGRRGKQRLLSNGDLRR